MADLIEYKCPACGGALEFNSALQKMKCPFCDSEYSMEELKAKDEGLQNATGDVQSPAQNTEWDMSGGGEWSEEETSNLRSYVCRSCGGEIVGDATTAATKCPFCDNPVVMSGQFSGMLKPDLVIPFKLDKNAAKESLKRHLKGKLLLPKMFKSQNHIDEVKGVYVPFWLFDTGVSANVRFEGTRVRRWSDKEYDYTETSYYDIHRSGNIAFANIPVDGSSKMPDDLMESVEPFDISQAMDFQTAYLAGYVADKYDVGEQNCVDRANARVKTSTQDAFASTVSGYESVRPVYSSMQLTNAKAKYALLPVWVLNTTWNGQKYTFAMNGQTGKFVGDLPMDKGAFYRWFGGVAAAAAAAAFGLLYLLWVL